MAKTLEAGKLIVGSVAVYLDPIGTAATILGIDTTLQIDTWLSKQPDILKLARELDKKFAARFDKPDDARVLIPQMLDVSVVTGQGMAESGLDADLTCYKMKTKINSLRQGYDRIELLQAFEDLVLPLLKETCNDPRLKAAIDPELTRQKMKSLWEIQSEQRKQRKLLARRRHVTSS